jgi:hypothetical protein
VTHLDSVRTAVADMNPLEGSSQYVASIFQPLSATTLNRLSQQSIRTFLQDCDGYVSALQERRNQPGGEALVASSLVASIDRDILQNLCMLGDLGAVSSVDEVRDAHVKAWLDGFRTRRAELVSEADIDALAKGKVRMNLKERDSSSRTLELFSSYLSVLRTNGLEWLVFEHPKKCVAQMVEALRPEQLQARIMSDLQSLMQIFGRIS